MEEREIPTKIYEILDLLEMTTKIPSNLCLPELRYIDYIPFY